MKFLFVIANPNPDSFTHRMLRHAVNAVWRNGHSAVVSDLYADGFEPLASRADFLDVADSGHFDYQLEQRHAVVTVSFDPALLREQKRLAEADALVLLFPLWWASAPAVMKGWFDRVLAAGFAYDDGERYKTGRWQNKIGLIGTATGGSANRFVEGHSHGSTTQVLWPIQHGVLEYLGMNTADPFVAFAAARSSDEQQKEYLKEWERRVLSLADLAKQSRQREGAAKGS